MTIRYRRTGGRRAPGEPGEDERLDINGAGRFILWRSTGTPAIGRFGEVLDDGLSKQVADEASAARESGPLDVLPGPGASREVIDVDGVVASMGHPDEPEGPWGILARRLRALADALIDQPEAAIALEVADDGGVARLAHRGTDAIAVDLSALTVAAHLWKGYYEPAGSWERGPLDLASSAISAGPGWTRELPFEHGLQAGSGRSLQVAVGFAVHDGAEWVRVSVARVPIIEPPGGGRRR